MNQQSQSTSSHPVERVDELSLGGLWKVLVKYKLFVIIFTALTTLSAVFYLSTLPTVYKAEVLMLPAGGGATGGFTSSNKLSGLAGIAGISLGGGGSGPEGERALARLKTRSFLINHIKEKNLKYILFADRWNETEKHWIDQEPSDTEASRLLLGMMGTSSDPRDIAGLVTVSLRWEDPSSPNKIAEIANNLVSSINFHAKQRAILEAKNSILFLEKELEQTSILNAQTILYNLIERQTAKIMMANVTDEFIFKVIDPAIVPEQAETKPILAIITIGAMLGIFLSLFLAVSINYFKE